MRKMAFLAAMAVAVVLAAGAEQPKYSEVKFLVLKDYNGKPVRNASVVLHQLEKEGKQAKGGLQLKTSADGKTSYDAVPYGKLRVQVIASGFQTYGEDYDINQPEQEIVIKLKRPKEQYSIYK